MGNVQKQNYFINVLSSETFRAYIDVIVFDEIYRTLRDRYFRIICFIFLTARDLFRFEISDECKEIPPNLFL